MDYEKSYKDALEKARFLRQQAAEGGNPLMANRYEQIFPELRESEDERIRKGLSKFLWDVANGEVKSMPSASQCQEWLTYLEKQKEPIPILNKFNGLKSLMLQYLQSAANRKDDAEIEDDTDLYGRKILDYIWKYDGTQKEQQSDGKAMLHVAEKSYQIGLRDGKMEQNAEPFSCGHENGSSEKPNNQWSEEDESMLRTIISDGSRGVELDSKQISWLKSLRPQPHWKPSEEQMKSLLYAEGYLRRYECREIARDIAELYNDLKKLM